MKNHIYSVFLGGAAVTLAACLNNMGAGPASTGPTSNQSFGPANSGWFGAGNGSPLSFQGACKDVKVDCNSHTITINGSAPATIDCGGGARRGQQTITGTGKIGGEHRGTRVPFGVTIVNFPGMGQSGGGKVFHCPDSRTYQGAGVPRGTNWTRGCIAVSPAILAQLRKCQGASLSVIGTDAKGKAMANQNRSLAGDRFQRNGSR